MAGGPSVAMPLENMQSSLLIVLPWHKLLLLLNCQAPLSNRTKHLRSRIPEIDSDAVRMLELLVVV